MAVSTASLLFTGGLGATAATLTLGQLAIGGLVFMGVSTVVTSALMPKPDFSSMGGNLQTSMDSIGGAAIVYGETRKSGTKTYHETTGGGKFYHYILTLAIHEVEDIGDIYINDEVVTLDQSGYVTGDDWQSKILIKKFTGASGQNVKATLDALAEKPVGITSTFKGQGVAALYIRLETDQDVFQSGIPLVTAVVRGKKIYDPRKDSTSAGYDATLGVSSHRVSNPSTWEYSNSPPLAARDYLTSILGVNCDQSEIDDIAVARAATDCKTTGDPSVEENSFEVNGSLSCANSKKKNLKLLMDTMNGTLFWSQGKFRLIAGAYRAPEISEPFTLDDVRGDSISIQTRYSRSDLVNTVRGTFTDRETRWIASEFPQIQLSDMSEDNGVESIIDLELPLVTKSAAAQRLAKQILYTSREQITLSTRFSAKAFGVQVGDTIKVTMSRYGWDEKVFLVKGWKAYGGDGGAIEVELTLQETSPEAYFWSVGSEEYAQIIRNNTSLDKMSAGLTISTLNTQTPAPKIQSDGTALGSIIASWSIPSNGNVARYNIEWKRTSSTDWNASTSTLNSFTLEPLIVGLQYDIRVQAVTIRGNRGPWKEATATVSGDTTAPSKPSFSTFSAIGGYQDVKLSWERPPETDFSHVEVYRGTTLIGSSSGTTFTDGGLANETSFTYKLRSVDLSGNRSGYTSTRTATTLAEIQGPTGVEGARGAGRWSIPIDNIPVETGPVDAAFRAYVGAPVNLDQAWFVDNQDQTQAVWIYEAATSTWNFQEEVIHGDLVVSKTITSDKIQVNSLSAISATLGDVVIENTLQLQAGGAGFIGGRTTNSAYNEDGFYIARTDKGNGDKGFEVSHTSIRNNKIEGIIHKDDGGLQIFNPTFFRGGSSTGGISTVASSTSVNAGEGDSVTVTVYGGGGAGGFGLGDGYSSGRNNSGGTTTAQIRAGSPTGTIISTVSASGGLGGLNANGNGITGGAGASSTFGFGGAAVGTNVSGNDAPTTHYGAGGGGAGGDSSSWFDSSGGGGTGGSAGQAVTQTVDTSAYAGQDIYIVTSIGAGGVSTGGNYQGGTGASGAVSYSSILGGTTQVTLDQLINNVIPAINITGTTPTPSYSLNPSGYFMSSFNVSATVAGTARDNRISYTIALQYEVDGNGVWIPFGTGSGVSGYGASNSVTTDFYITQVLDLLGHSFVRFRASSGTVAGSGYLIGPFGS